MTTIFDGYKNLTDEQIIDQITILETINFTNSMKLYRNKVKESTVKVIKKIWNNIEKDTETEEIKTKEIYETLEENKQKLMELSRQELDIKLKLLLCDKVESDIELSEEEISLDIVNEAIKILDIGDYLTPAQKIDEIFDIYNEKVKKYLELKINEDSEDKENKKIKLEEINTNINFLMEVIIENIKSKDIIYGSKKIDREILSQSIWISALNYGKKFSPYIEELPSSSLSIVKDEMIKEDDQFFKLKSNYQKAINELDENEIRHMDLENELDEVKKSIENKKYTRLETENTNNQLNKKIIDIESELLYIVNNLEVLEKEVGYLSDRIEIRYSKVINRYNEMKKEFDLKKQEIRDIKNEIKEKEIKILSLTEAIKNDDKNINNMTIKVEYLQEEIKRLKKVRSQAEKEYLEEKETRYKKLKNLWNLYFKDIDIQPQFIKEVVEYRLNDRLKIERVIKELQESKNPATISRNFRKKEKKENFYIDIMLNEYKQVRLEYKIEEYNENKINLIRVYHGDKIYLD